MTKPLPQTRLGAACRKLAEKHEDDVAKRLLVLYAAKLDLTAHSLAARGERVKQLGAYRRALRTYNKYAPEPYAGT